MIFVFFSSRRRHTSCALVTGVQTCALPISGAEVRGVGAGVEQARAGGPWPTVVAACARRLPRLVFRRGHGVSSDSGNGAAARARTARAAMPGACPAARAKTATAAAKQIGRAHV